MNVKNLTKLFEIQSRLDKRIVKMRGLEGQDLLSRKHLALLVELAECANEWRGFKFWSAKQEPRTKSKVVCHACTGAGSFITGDGEEDSEVCGYCDGTGFQENRNPLLEEYVDSLHFILSIGLDLNVLKNYPKLELDIWTQMDRNRMLFYRRDISDLFKQIICGEWHSSFMYPILTAGFFLLGERLGFTWGEVEQAYMEKNAVNHKRQETGY